MEDSGDWNSESQGGKNKEKKEERKEKPKERKKNRSKESSRGIEDLGWGERG